MPVLIMLLLLIILIFGVGYFFATKIVYPRVYPFEETYKIEVEGGRFKPEDYEAYPRQEIEILSPFGYTLSGTYIPCEGSRKTAILCHGITLSRFNTVKYIPLFRSRGFNVIIYDHRNHGKSGGRNTTFGFFEKYDLKAVVDWALAQLGEGGVIGTMGESLGGGTVLQHIAIDPRPAFVIADCAYSDFRQLVTYRARVEYHAPAFPLVPLASFLTHLLAGFSLEQAAPIATLPQVETPILFTTGEKDDYVPTQMTRDLYAAKTRGMRKLLIVPEAEHGQAYFTNPQMYDQAVGEFLRELHLA